MIKIAFILPSLYNRGPVVFTKNLTDALLETGVFCKIYYFKPGGDVFFEAKSHQIHIFQNDFLREFDIVHTTGAMPDLYGLFVSRLYPNIIWVSSAHNFFKEDLGRLYGKIKFLLYSSIWYIPLRCVKNFIVSSQQMLDYYHANCGDKNYRIIPYGITPSESQPCDNVDVCLLESLSSKYKIIGSVGLLIQRKGYHQLIEYLERDHNSAVVLIGDGKDRQSLELLASERGVKDRFFILGFKNYSRRYYKFFDVFAMTSSSEGFGLAMLEAMEAKLPIVCSNLAIYHDYFTNSEVCFFEYGNIDSLSNAINLSVAKCDYYSMTSYSLFKNKFSIRAMAESHKCFYNELISKMDVDRSNNG